MKKRILSLLLCLSLLLACVPAASAAPSDEPVYLHVADWALEAVRSMDRLGFLPRDLQTADMSQPITRGEMAQMASLLYANIRAQEPFPDAGSKNQFTDTKDPLIIFAYEQGLVTGYEDGSFRPGRKLMRQDFFRIVYNVMGSCDWAPGKLELNDLSQFSDASLIRDYALEATRIMVTIGIVQGSGGRLSPMHDTTRQQAILMFFRCYQYLGSWINNLSQESDSMQLENSGYSGISSWAIREVKQMGDLGLIPKSLDNCNMSNTITRGQMSSIAVLAYQKILKLTELKPQRTDHFTDTTDPDINLAFELKLITGYPGNLAKPDKTLNREEFFKIMANFMAAIGYPRDDSRSVSLSQFRDGNSVSDWAKPSTRLLIYIGAVNGDGKNLTPKRGTKIEEAIAIFFRCYKYTVAWHEKYPDGQELPPSIVDDLLAFAKRYEGYPYVWAGAGPNAFDCSGYICYVYGHFGYSLLHGAQEQYIAGTHVNKSDLLPGDLVFFAGYSGVNHNNSGFRSITHVGIYLGDGKFIHAANPSRGVVIDSITSGYYNSHYWGGCRIIKDA